MPNEIRLILRQVYRTLVKDAAESHYDTHRAKKRADLILVIRSANNGLMRPRGARLWEFNT